MKYDTHNLDEAAYLALQGYNPTTTRTGPISALYSFEIDDHFNEVRAKFWKGEATVPLHSWLTTRAALKNECAGQALALKSVSSPPLVPEECKTEIAPPRGSRYWFYDGAKIKCEIFGMKSQHISRFNEGNFYPTLRDAELKRNARQVVGST